MERYRVDPDSTALVVVDMTNDFLEPGVPQECPAGREIVPRLALLIEECRRAGVVVLYTSHVHRADGSDMGRMADSFTHLVDAERRPITLIEGTRGVEVVDQLAPAPGEIVIRKSRYSAFYNTDLETVLRNKGVTTLIIGGVATNICCESTARDAMFRDYRVIFLADGNATLDLPDLGWGPIDHDEVQRVVLSTLAAGFCEVAGVDDVISRVRAAGDAAGPSEEGSSVGVGAGVESPR